MNPRLMLLFAAMLPLLSAHAQETVTGPGADRTVNWRLERRWSIGGGDDAELVLSLMGAKDIAVDTRGRLLVVDRTANRVVVYDSAGRPAGTLGRQGMGPGELSFPLAVAVSPDGAVHVYDGAKSAVVVFSASGRIQPEYRPRPRLITWSFQGSSTVVGLSNRADSLRLLRIQAGTSTTLAAIAQPKTRSVIGVCGLTDWPAAPIFAPTIAWANRNTYTVATSGAYRISVFENGHRTRVLTRDAARRRATAALARQQVGPGAAMQIQGMNPCTVPADRILQTAEVADELPAYASLLIAPDNRIWAMRYTVRGEPERVDLYDPVRGYEGTLLLGAVRPIAFLGRDVLISLERDADDVPMIVAYKVHRR